MNNTRTTHLTLKRTRPPQVQRFKRVCTIRCLDYVKASVQRAVMLSYPDSRSSGARVKIRRRPAGHFDVITYKPIEAEA